MRIEIITEPITRAEAQEIAKEVYGDMVKGVADIEQGVIALGGKWHICEHEACRVRVKTTIGMGLQFVYRERRGGTYRVCRACQHTSHSRQLRHVH